MAIANIELSNMKSSSFKKAVIVAGASAVLSLRLFVDSLHLPTVITDGTKTAPAKTLTSAPVEQMTTSKNIVLFIRDGIDKAIRDTVGKNGTLKMDNMPIDDLLVKLLKLK
ncbi:hypothetical protein ACFSGI_00915 [Paenibacillus nicotianae]|uniref:Uncharacterized protein n=1 Tax=Paenibacillus nicotianae TaxID=1526551 RepID=A0ABW4UQ57_9BACL